MAVKAVACELPRTLELPLSRLFVPDIQKEVIRQGIVASISGSTVWRWLDHDAIRPWTFRSWIFPRDPLFEAKAGVVLDLYARQFEGKALGDNDFVVSADEKTSIQARCRCHPSVPAAESRAMLIEHEYDRGGALQYLAAWDVGRAKVFGRCEATTGIEPFGRLVDQVMSTEPYASARLLDRRQWFVAPRPGLHQTSGGALPEGGPPAAAADPLPGPRLVAEPDRDFLLHRPAQGADAQRLHRPRRGRAATVGLRALLRGGGSALRVEIHASGPR